MGLYFAAEGAFKIATLSAFWDRARMGKQIVFEVGITQTSCVRLSVLSCLLKIEQIFAGVCFCVSYLKLFCVVFQAAIPTPSGGPPLQW